MTRVLKIVGMQSSVTLVNEISRRSLAVFVWQRYETHIVEQVLVLIFLNERLCNAPVHV